MIQDYSNDHLYFCCLMLLRGRFFWARPKQSVHPPADAPWHIILGAKLWSGVMLKTPTSAASWNQTLKFQHHMTGNEIRMLSWNRYVILMQSDAWFRTAPKNNCSTSLLKCWSPSLLVSQVATSSGCWKLEDNRNVVQTSFEVHLKQHFATEDLHMRLIRHIFP